MKYVVNVYGPVAASKDSDIIGATESLLNGLQHALKNKFPDDDFYFTLIDMDSGDNITDYDENLIEQMENGDLSPPLITINDEIAAHGDAAAGTVIKWLEQKS